VKLEDELHFFVAVVVVVCMFKLISVNFDLEPMELLVLKKKSQFSSLACTLDRFQAPPSFIA